MRRKADQLDEAGFLAEAGQTVVTSGKSDEEDIGKNQDGSAENDGSLECSIADQVDVGACEEKKEGKEEEEKQRSTENSTAVTIDTE